MDRDEVESYTSDYSASIRKTWALPASAYGVSGGYRECRRLAITAPENFKQQG